MCKLLITGAPGQLAQALAATQPKHTSLHPTYATRQEVDITQLTALRAYFTAYPVQFVVNCAAYTNVDQAEKDQVAAYAVNVLAPRHLALLAQELNFTLLHISTDYVFEGRLAQPLDESMPTGPINYYGYTKRLGEEQIQACATKAYIIRTSWLYSYLAHNSLTRLYKNAAAGQALLMPYDQIGSPTYAIDLAQAIWSILEQLVQVPTAYSPGTYHYAGQGVASRYDLAWNACKIAHWTGSVVPLRSADLKGLAKRPAYSVLDTTRIKQIFGLTIPHWQDSLARCLDHINRHGL